MSAAEEKKYRLKAEVERCVFELYGIEGEFNVIRPKFKNKESLCTAAAFVLSKELKRAPMDIAGEIAKRLSLKDGDYALAEGKGYINFYLKPDFMIEALKKDLELPYVELPPLESEEFSEVYPVARLNAVLKCQGTKGDNPKFTKESEPLLWALFFGSRNEILKCAVEFYDKTGLKNTDKAIAQGNTLLLGNAVYELMKGIKK